MTVVLTVLPDFPIPATTGLHLRMLANLRLVHALGCESHLLYFSTEGRVHDPYHFDLARVTSSVTWGGQRKEQHEFSRTALIGHKTSFLVRGTFGRPGTRYPYSMRYDAIGGAKRIADVARRIAADVVILPSFCVHYAPFLATQGHRIIADASDVFSRLSRQFYENYQDQSRGGRLGLWANLVATRTQERRFLPFCDEIWATTQDEADELSTLTGSETRSLVVPNMLAEDIPEPTPLPAAGAIGFIGTYSYAPNLDAARFLADEVFPLVHEVLPDTRLSLAGAGMPEEIRARLARRPGVEARGAVDNAGAFFDACLALALPIRVRGGVPLKLVEAFARGRPVIASPELVHGLPLQNEQQLEIRSDARGFAESIVSLLSDRGRANALAVRARAYYDEQWSLSAVVSRLRSLSVLGKPTTSA